MNLPTLQAALVAKAIADTSATVELAGPLGLRARLSSAGLTAVLPFGVVAGFDLASDSNRAYAIAQVRLTMLHRLSDPTNEDAYLDGAMAADLALLMDWRWWRIPEAFNVLEGFPELTVPTRVGAVIRYAVDCQLRYLP